MCWVKKKNRNRNTHPVHTFMLLVFYFFFEKTSFLWRVSSPYLNHQIALDLMVQEYANDMFILRSEGLLFHSHIKSFFCDVRGVDS